MHLLQRARFVQGLLLAIIMVLVVALLACGTPAAQGSLTPQASPTPKAEQPKYGGILRYLEEGAPASWDPQQGLLYNPAYTQPIFSNLVQFDPTKPEIRPENVIGDLAEKWDVSTDGKTYTFYLRRGVKWHDGTPFTAKDVVANFSKLMDKTRSAAVIADQLRAYDRSEAADDYTVKVYLSRPQPSFVPILATANFAMVPTYRTMDYKSTNSLVGTGPFKFKTYTAGSSMELVRNPDYFRKDEAGNQLPYLDGITINVIADKSAQQDALVTKRLDMMKPAVGLSDKAGIDRIVAQAPEAVVSRFPKMGVVAWWFNLAHKALSDLRVRQALALATDVDAAILGGHGSPAFRDRDVWYFPKPYGVSREEQNRILGWDKTLDQRIATAKKLLAEAGFASGFKVAAMTNNQAPHVQALQMLTDQWRKVGVEVAIVAIPTAEFNQRQSARDFDIMTATPSIMANDPDEGSATIGRGGWTNPEFAKLNSQQSVSTALSERVRLTQRMEEILLTDLPLISQGAGAYPTAYWPWVKGFVKHDAYYTSYLRMERVWIDASLRK